MRLVDAWVLTRYEDADAMLRDHERFGAEDRRFYDAGLTTLLDIDPPDHTRLRALVSRAFTPRSVRGWHDRVQAIADRLLDAVAGQDRFDLIATLGYPLPVTVIAEMLGVPAEDMGPVRGLVQRHRAHRRADPHAHAGRERFGVPPRNFSPTSRPSWRHGSAPPGTIS